MKVSVGRTARVAEFSGPILQSPRLQCLNTLLFYLYGLETAAAYIQASQTN